MCAATDALEHFRVDDPVGAVPVHLAAGIWGTLSLGLFATGEYGVPTATGADVSATVTGLFYGGSVSQLVAQAVGSAAIVTATLVTSFALMYGLHGSGLLRVPEHGERVGLDRHEHAAAAYPELDGSPAARDGAAARRTQGGGRHRRCPAPRRPLSRPVRSDISVPLGAILHSCRCDFATSVAASLRDHENSAVIERSAERRADGQLIRLWHGPWNCCRQEGLDGQFDARLRDAGVPGGVHLPQRRAVRGRQPAVRCCSSSRLAPRGAVPEGQGDHRAAESRTHDDGGGHRWYLQDWE